MVGEGLKYNIEYRADIDALRGLAVLAVVVFHTFPSLLPGGFVGVDVFFVISGYLVTKIIVNSKQRGSFSFLDFYSRRFRRIIPALLVVLIFTAGLSALFLLPDEIESLGKHIVAAATFSNNFILWSEANYFDKAAETKPLLHLWSLSVEEQYYLLWPFLVLLIWRLGKYSLAVLGVLFGLSFFANVFMVDERPAQVFYLLPYRFWELAAGAMVVAAERHMAPLKPRQCETLSFIGLVLIIISMVLFKGLTRYPGYLGLLPVLGTALLIWSGERSFVGRKLTANRFLVFIGLISYPLYLWHWPLLTIARLRLADGGWVLTIVCAFLAVLSVGLSFLTWKIVELPIRRFQIFNISPVKLVCSTLLLLALTVGVGWAFKSGLLMSERQRHALEILKNYRSIYLAEYRTDICYFGEANTKPTDFLEECYLPDFSRRRIFIWGDSFAAHLYYGINKVADKSNFQILQITSSCVPVLDWASDPHSKCKEINDFAFEKIRQAKPLVVLATNWINNHERPDFFEKLSYTLKRLEELKVPILVVGQMPLWQDGLPKVIQRNFIMKGLTVPERAIAGLDKKVNFVDNKLTNFFEKSSLESQQLLRPLKELCSEKGCLVLVGQDLQTSLISFDAGHFTPLGSIYFAKNILYPYLFNATEK